MKHPKLNRILILLFSSCLVGCQVFSKTPNTNEFHTGYVHFGQTNDYKGVQMNGNNAVINQGGQYELSGNCSNGQIIVNTQEDVELILDGLELTCENNSPIFIKNARSLTINLKNESHLSDTKNYLLNKEGGTAVIYSQSDLIFRGDGKLKISANYQNGIETTAHLLIQSGQFEMASLMHGFVSGNQMIIENIEGQIDSEGNGIKAKVLSVKNGNVNITSKKDAVVAEDIDISQGNWQVTSLDKGFVVENKLSIRDGAFNITTKHDGWSAKEILIYQGALIMNTTAIGIVAQDDLAIYGGNINIENSQIALQASNIEINDGTLHIMSIEDGMKVLNAQGNGECIINNGNLIMDSGGYGFNINGKLRIEGGTVYLNGPLNSQFTPLNCSGGYVVDNGILCMLDGTNLAQIPQVESLQMGMILTFLQPLPAGTSIMIKDHNQSNVFEYTSLKSFTTLHLSSYKFTNGDTYSLYMNNSFYGEILLNSHYPQIVY